MQAAGSNKGDGKHLFKIPINPFGPNAPFLHPLKTSENHTVFCFQGVGNGCFENEWINTYWWLELSISDVKGIFYALKKKLK